MAALVEILKRLIREIQTMIDRGDCDDISEDQLEEISIIIHEPTYIGREEAANILHVSMNRFYELRDCGKIPMPKKVKGHKEKMYNRYEICKCMKLLELQD